MSSDKPKVLTVAQGYRLGLTRKTMRSARFSSPTRGVRILGEPPNAFYARVVAASLARPGSVISHQTAALLLGLPGGSDDAVHVTETIDHDKWRAHGTRDDVVSHRNDLPAEMTMPIGGVVAEPTDFSAGQRAIDQVGRSLVRGVPVRVTTPIRTLIDLAGSGWKRDRLTVFGDAIVSKRFAYASPDDVRSAIDRVHGARGARELRKAAALIRTGTDSAMETRTRLLIVNAGLPEPEVNVPIRHPETGAVLIQPDLAYLRLRIGIEYDGEHHRMDRTQWQRDVRRRDRYAELGWRLKVVTSEGVQNPVPTIQAIRRLIAAASAE